MARAGRAQARVRARRDRRAIFGRRARAKPGVDLETFVASRDRSHERARHRTVLDLPRTRQTDGRKRARDALQRALSLGGSAGTRDRRRAARSRRHYVITHAYWREGGPEFHDVNVMAVAHGMEKPVVLAHKAAIDEHLREAGIDFAYTNVFWGGRSEIKPSEIAPARIASFATLAVSIPSRCAPKRRGRSVCVKLRSYLPS